MRHFLFIFFFLTQISLLSQSHLVQYYFPTPIYSPTPLPENQLHFGFGTIIDNEVDIQGAHFFNGAFSPFDKFIIGGGVFMQSRKFTNFSPQIHHKVKAYQIQLGYLIEKKYLRNSIYSDFFLGTSLNNSRDNRTYSNLGIHTGFEDGFSDFQFKSLEIYGQGKFGFARQGSIDLNIGMTVKIANVNVYESVHVSNFDQPDLYNPNFWITQLGPFGKIGKNGWWLEGQISLYVFLSDKPAIYAATGNASPGFVIFNFSNIDFGTEAIYFQIGFGKTLNLIKNHSK